MVKNSKHPCLEGEEADSITMLLLEACAPAAALVDQRHEILFHHGTMVDYLELPAGQPSANFLSMARPGLRTRLRSVVQRALETQETVVDDAARVKRAGRYVRCSITARPVKDPPGRAGLVLLTFEDRAAEAGAEAAKTASRPAVEESPAFAQLESELRGKLIDLESANNDFANLLDASSVAMLFLDEEMRIKLFTQPTARLLSLIPADIGRPIGEFSAKISNEGLVTDARRVIRELTPIQKDVWSEGEEPTCYLRSIVPYQTSEKRIEGVVITYIDVTSRKREEKARDRILAERTTTLDEYQMKLESIIDTAEDGIITIDSEGTIDVFNPAAEKLFGYSRAEVVGRNVKALMPEEVAAEHDRYIRNYLDTGEARVIGVGREVIARRKDGRPVPLEVRVGAFPEGQFCGFLRDLSERKRLEAEYLQAQKMEAVGRLAGGVAHDFNNLLAGILGGLRVAMKGLSERDPIVPTLTEVIEEVARGASITRRLLDFSRTKSSAPRPVNASECMLGADRIIRRLIGEDIEFRIDCDTAGTRVFADHQLIEQALINLAINARDAMPHGGQLLFRCWDAELSDDDLQCLSSKAEAGNFVVFSVEDSGVGMDEATRKSSTEAFFTTKGPGLGTGLGLSTVASVVRSWGGFLHIKSELGQGTQVRLFLPRATGAADVPDADAGQTPAVLAGAGETVLVVEDEKLVRLGVRQQLEDLGYVVLTAGTAHEALEVLRARSIVLDLLLTDVVLPGMSGPELIVAAREQRPRLAVLLMSAFPQEELVAHGRIEPGTPTLEKPFTDKALGLKVHEALSAGRTSSSGD